MHRIRRVNDALHRYMGELTARVVAESGIPSDRLHLGKIILQSLKDAPDFLLQIDGATKETETNQSVLERSVRCAIALKKLGLKCGDVMVLMAPNNIDLAIPLYAAMYLGITVAATDRFLTANELRASFEVIEPKVVFCQNEKLSDVNKALDTLDLKTDVFTFDGQDGVVSFASFLKSCTDETSIKQFKATDFDPDETNAFVIATSGTTGVPKAASLTHTNVVIAFPYTWVRHFQFPSPVHMACVASHLQWMTALIHYVLSPILRYTRVQSSQNFTPEHAWYLINTYKPTYMFVSPTLMATLVTDPDKCDFTCFEMIQLGGSAVSDKLIDSIKKITPNTEVVNVYGMSEVGYGFNPDNSPRGSSGKPIGYLNYRLVDVETREDITAPNVPGELWMKGPTVFKGYYKNPEATKEVFAEDGWFMSGDMFYRDENWNFFFVERIKLLLKYMNHQISPVEVEGVIRQHPGVSDVAVTGIPDPDRGELVVACVVRQSGHNVTAQEIKDLVKDQLADSKQLRGGVIFLKELPLTSSGKLHRRKVKELAQHLKKE